MEPRAEEAIELILQNEGGLVDDPNDSGGITNYGISFRFYKSINDEASPEEIRNLSKQDAKEIYYIYWYKKYHYSEINNEILMQKVFDFAVNMGPGRAHELLQQAANFEYRENKLAIDGILGPKTFEAVNRLNSNKIIRNLVLLASYYYIKITENNSKNLRFINGWLARALADIPVEQIFI